MAGTVPARILDKLAKNGAADSASGGQGGRDPEGHMHVCSYAHCGLLVPATAKATPRSSSRGPGVSPLRAAEEGTEAQRGADAEARPGSLSQDVPGLDYVRQQVSHPRT